MTTVTLNRATMKFDGLAAEGYQCWCGIAFAVPKSLLDYFRRANEEEPGRFPLYCPLGHAMILAGKSQSDKLRDQLAAEKHAREQADANAKYLSGRVSELYAESARKDRRINGYKGALGRVKKRVAKGSCPCCSMKFKDLKAHMTTAHPDWNPEQHAEALAGKAT